MVFGFILFLVLILTYILFKKYKSKIRTLNFKGFFTFSFILIPFVFILTFLFNLKSLKLFNKYLKNILTNNTSIYYFVKLKNFLLNNKINILKVSPFSVTRYEDYKEDDIKTKQYVSNKLEKNALNNINKNKVNMEALIKQLPALRELANNNEFSYLTPITNTEMSKLFEVLDKKKQFLKTLKEGTNSNETSFDALNFPLISINDLDSTLQFILKKNFLEGLNDLILKNFKEEVLRNFDANFDPNNLQINSNTQVSKFYDIYNHSIGIHRHFLKNSKHIETRTKIKYPSTFQSKLDIYKNSLYLLHFFDHHSTVLQEETEITNIIDFMRINNKTLQEFYKICVKNIEELDQARINFENHFSENQRKTKYLNDELDAIKFCAERKKQNQSNNNNNKSKLKSFFDFFKIDNFITNFFAKIGSFFFSSKKKSEDFVDENYVEAINVKNQQITLFDLETKKEFIVLANQYLTAFRTARANIRNLEKQNYIINQQYRNIYSKDRIQEYLNKNLSINLNRIQYFTDDQKKYYDFYYKQYIYSVNPEFAKKNFGNEIVSDFQNIPYTGPELKSRTHYNKQFSTTGNSFLELGLSKRANLKRQYAYFEKKSKIPFFPSNVTNHFLNVKKKIDSEPDSDEDLDIIKTEENYQAANDLLEKINYDTDRVKFFESNSKTQLIVDELDFRTSLNTLNSPKKTVISDNKKSSSGKEEDVSKYQ